MLNKEIVQKNNTILRQDAKLVSDPKSPEIKSIIKDMARALFNEPDGIGLAAPQIGVSLTIFIVSNDVFEPEKIKDRTNTSKLENIGYTVFVNPSIIKISSKKIKDVEGCLSVRGFYGDVIRPEKLTVRYLDENGKKLTRGTSGLLARVIQHEMDHLQGILFIDKATNINRVSQNTKHETS